MGKASRNKMAKRKSGLHNAGWGFDYGLSIHAAAVGSFQFTNRLREANIIGIAYGIQYSDALKCDVPFISLLGINDAPLRQAFEEFAHWADYSDADAIDITLVFFKNGGYCFMISPEPKALMARTIKHNAIVEPISFQVSWMKPIDTVSEPLKQLRAHLEKGIRPYIFTASSYSGEAKPGISLKPELINAVSGIKQLLKFNIRFVDEGSETEKDLVRMALISNGTTKITDAEHKPPLPSAKRLMNTRMNRLKTIFPVTIWRAENHFFCMKICEQAMQLGLRRWQVQQSLCNSILSHEITNGRSHFEGIKQKDWPNKLVTILEQRYEIADGRNYICNSLTSKELVRQAMLDAEVLLHTWGLNTVPNTIEAIQKELLNRGLLDEPVE